MLAVVLLVCCRLAVAVGDDQARQDYPPVLVAFNARNSAALLPWFLGQLEQLDYPKHRLHLRITSDHNEDNTAQLLQQWLDGVRPLYASVQFAQDGTSTSYEDEQGPFHWSEQRMRTVMQHKQRALEAARTAADIEYLFLLDTDALLTESRVLRELVTWQRPIVAPMLTVKGTNHSNFWAAIDANGYFRETPDYFDIIAFKEPGSHHVAMVHSAVLVDVKDPRAGKLTFLPENLENYKMAEDDLVVFGESTDLAGMDMYVLNTAHWGYLLPSPDESHGLLDLNEQMLYLLCELVEQRVDSLPMLYSPFVRPQLPPKTTLGLHKIYMINLQRRPERRYRMDYLFDLQGLDVTHWPATDGRLLNASVLQQRGIQLLPGYEDPFHKRPLKFGEIGCFLSHYSVWKDAVENKLDKVMVLEDDVRFGKYFSWRVKRLLAELEQNQLEWDLIYLSRKYMGWRYEDDDPDAINEQMVNGFTELHTIDYSYWTVGYLLSGRGAERLLAARPLQHLMALDEFLPVMYNRQPHKQWNEPFKAADKLKAFGLYPQLISPSHYTYEAGYVTDTEASELVTDLPHAHQLHHDPHSEL